MTHDQDPRAMSSKTTVEVGVNVESRRVSPALLVAVIALVAALAGSAVALPGKNQVDKNDLKKGSVTKKALKKNAVTSKAIKNNGVTGTDVNESTLGPVPNADSASSVTFLRQFNVRMSFGQDVELVSNGPVSLRARCVANGTINGTASQDGVQVYARTTQAGSFMDGSDDRSGDSDGDGLEDAESLDPPDAIDDTSFEQLSFATGGPNEQGVLSQIDEGFVVGPNGSYIGVDSEELLLAVRALGADCAVIGMAQLQG